MGAFASQGVAGTFDMRSGDVGTCRFALTATASRTSAREPLVILEMFRKPPVRVASSLTQCDGRRPGQVSADTLNRAREN